MSCYNHFFTLTTRTTVVSLVLLPMVFKQMQPWCWPDYNYWSCSLLIRLKSPTVADSAALNFRPARHYLVVCHLCLLDEILSRLKFLVIDFSILTAHWSCLGVLKYCFQRCPHLKCYFLCANFQQFSFYCCRNFHGSSPLQKTLDGFTPSS